MATAGPSVEAPIEPCIYCDLCDDLLNPRPHVHYNQLIYACENCNSRYTNTTDCIYVYRTTRDIDEMWNVDHLDRKLCPKCSSTHAKFFHSLTRFALQRMKLFYVCRSRYCRNRHPIM